GRAQPVSIASKTAMFRGHPRRVHWVTLTELKPSTTYKFRAGDTRYGMSKWRTFRTLPGNHEPIRVITGGDMFSRESAVELLKAGAERKPDVGLVGGDIAYAGGEYRNLLYWDRWLDNWDKNLVREDGRMVPMICAIGNHEVQGGFGKSRDRAPFYFAFFPQGGEAYFTRNLGLDVELVVLDSGHVNSHTSQVPFLEKTLSQSPAAYQVALYHVPCYPTYRSFNNRYSKAGRESWAPVFDKYKLPLAFENHEHCFKRTFPLNAGKVVKSDGTTYLGDGCWGMTPREIKGKRWYHAKAESREHFWIFEKGPQGLLCQAVDTEGTVFDSVTIPSRR
ncbi:MAG: metallophosphoesterase family protein, partial [Candidatus Eremiobacteraeota bacterium]|nr:metallophosphoesterase family protein [Candidatus Eremiobacteraeota bacterium]